MNIDQGNGAIQFSNSIRIDSALTQDAVRTNPAFALTYRPHPHRLPWISYQLSGGEVDNQELNCSLRFHDQLLVDVEIAAELHTPEAWGKLRRSCRAAAATKHFHDLLLQRLLGEPSRTASIFFDGLPTIDRTLECPVIWVFQWGKVHSSYDPTVRGPYILVRYGNRFEEIISTYRSRRSGGAAGAGGDRHRAR